MVDVTNSDGLLTERLRADLAASQAECERLTGCLSKANAQAEHFEREWYLRGDEIERLRADAERYRLIQERFDTTKLSRSERFLEAIGLDPADAEKPLSDIVDAARAGKGE